MRPATTHSTPLVPQVRVSRRKLATYGTILAAAAAGAVTIAVVDDGDSGTQSLSRPAPDVRYDGGPNEGAAALAFRQTAPVSRPVEGAAVQSMSFGSDRVPVTRPQEGVAVQSMSFRSPPAPITRPQEGAAVLAMSHGSQNISPARPEEGAAVRSMGR